MALRHIHCSISDKAKCSGVNRDILLGKKLHNIGVGKSVHHIGNVSPALVLVCSSEARLQEVIAEAPGTGVNQLIDITL